jgi:predicted metal-dependent hydrolase
MRATWNGILSIVRSEPLEVAGLAWPVEVRHDPRARSLRLRLDERRGLLTLTCPRRVSRKTAVAWALKQSSWIDSQLAAVRPGEPFRPGALVPLEGERVQLLWRADAPRRPRLDDGTLECGGGAEGFGRRIERFLKDYSRSRLSEATAAVAERCGVTVRSVSVGDATSRWGSCSANGAIRYNWRLILAPPHILEWVVAHEVAHRRFMDHGTGFKRLEAELYGRDVAAARAELRTLGPRLKRVGRDV